MNEPDTRTNDDPTSDPLDALLAPLAKDAMPPDPAFLEQLRARTEAAFAASSPPYGPQPRRVGAGTDGGGAPAEPSSPKRRTMFTVPFRWAAASVAALLVLGLVTAFWLTRAPDPVAPDPDEPKFKAEENLADDGRIGTVLDAQGVVAVRPVGAERWSPVGPRLVLKPGDWLRTDPRGANAAALKLSSTSVIVGPRSTLELLSAKEFALTEGEVEVSATEAAPVTLTGPDKQRVVVKAKQLFRVVKEKLVRVDQEPLWLKGFKGAIANESVGSLIATVDGRATPLAVGYHHVTVDIRDQIARTTVEESFVNTTNDVLEGVFHFPLPADASISGFGMWIGNELVEADVVEKQRAREIYETILREKRDPGLLEWAGGNIFKARVYPIPARGEKRVKITYTQVLPLQGNRYRYSYALQSEMLKQNPLKELKIDVRVNSAVALKGVSSPTHLARVSKTESSGRVEFAAQEYTPSRDFEAVVELAPGRPDVVLIPHRRGDDGYFLVQLTPPGAAADWDRPLVPSGSPLKLLVVADTSASMDKSQRATQAAVLASLLGSLTPKDTLNVAACDVNCDWVFEKSVPATAANVSAAQDFLAKRASLGWTDLDRAFASILERTDANTHVIYLGDGASTTGTADPAAFANRLAKLYAGKAGTFHAVATGSSYEVAALKAIGTLGSGSVRRVSADRDARATALDLLTEIASPSLRNLKVEFRGLRTARVYPETLPNVPAGTQQILLGRYLPEGRDQSGEIVVTGTLAGKPVRFTSPVVLKDAESGNSFVPRLWARSHLDKLLEQGRSESVKQDIIRLSEEFNILTPYTSLLVLETDADRERFGVKRRFQMRDGERFFADGVAAATFDLKRKQMQRAADFRTALRRGVLADLNGLGRAAHLFRDRPRYEEFKRLKDAPDAYFLALGDPMGGEWEAAGLAVDLLEDQRALRSNFTIESPRTGSTRYERYAGGDVPDLEAQDATKGLEAFSEDRPALELAAPAKPGLPGEPEPLGEAAYDFDDDFGVPRQKLSTRGTGTYNRTDPGYLDDDKAVYNFAMYDFQNLRSYSGRTYDVPDGMVMLRKAAPAARPYYRRGPQLDWFTTLFPRIAAPAVAPKDAKSTWPADAVALSKSLLRADALAALKGGVIVTHQFDTFDPKGGELNARGARRELVSPGAWLIRNESQGSEIVVTWCDAKEYGAFGTGFRLGRVRPSNAEDLKQPPLAFDDYSVVPLDRSYSYMKAKVEQVAKGRALLILAQEGYPDDEIRVLIDTDRKVALSFESRRKNQIVRQLRFDDFVEVGGRWWARRVETLNDKGQRVALTTLTVKEVPAPEFTKSYELELAAKASALFLPAPLPTVDSAKKAVAAGKATLADRAVLAVYFAATQQWARALEHLNEFEKLAAGKPGARWLRNSFLLASRRHEELRKTLLTEAAALVKSADPETRANDLYLANYLLGQGDQVLEANERLALLESLKPVFDRQPARAAAAKAWRWRQWSAVEAVGQPDVALTLAKAFATDFPRDYYAQSRYAEMLASAGDHPGAYAWLTQALAPGRDWEPHQEEHLREVYARFLTQQGRFKELADSTAAWVKRNPESESPYAQHLAALVRSNQIDRANELTAQWLAEAKGDGELKPAALARIRAAYQFAIGSGYGLTRSDMDDRWFAPLAEAALALAGRDDTLSLAGQILRNGRFPGSDAARAVRARLAERFLKELEGEAVPIDRVQRLAEWVWSYTDTARGAAWAKPAAVLRKRWAAEKDPDQKHRLGATLLYVLGWLGDDEPLAFLRLRLKDAPEKYRPGYAADVFNALVNRPWAQATEDELFALLDQLPAKDEPAAGVLTKVAALHRLTDGLLAKRTEALAKAIEKPEALTRVELAKKQEEARKRARGELSDRLKAEAAKREKPFAAWIAAERAWLDVPFDRNLKDAAADAWAVLDAPEPKKPAKDAEFDANAAVTRVLDAALRERSLAVALNLAARRSADPALVARLLAYLDAKLKAEPDSPHWREEKYRALLALDRLKELEAALAQWAADPDAGSRWKVALGYLLAEQGKVPDAIKQFEAVRAADELSPAAHRALADWYQVEGRRADFDAARAAIFATTDEQALSNRINAYLAPWRRTSGPLPTTFDPEILETFKYLFVKATSPQNYLWQVQMFYQASRDFRLLSMLADGVVGHSAGKAYPFVQAMSGVLGEVRDEATADEIVKRIAELRKTQLTPVDRRALDLLELLVARRAAELVNQGGPHADKALAALQRAFKGDWTPGERRLMADFLASLGRVPQAELRKEQLRQLGELHAESAKGTLDRLQVAQRYAEVLNIHARGADAMDLLEAALAEFEAANGNALPTSGRGALEALVGLTEQVQHFDRGEKVLLAQRQRAAHPEYRRWLDRRLNTLYERTLGHKGTVSLGTGAALYKALEARLADGLRDADQKHRAEVFGQLLWVYRVAHRVGLPGPADLKNHAFNRLPAIFKEQTLDRDSIVNNTALALGELVGPLDALRFVLDRMDDEPAWVRYADRDPWVRYNTRLGYWLRERKEQKLGDLEPRLLKVVLDELRRDLRTREDRGRYLYEGRHSYFWEAKAADFLKAAEEVIAERAAVPGANEHIAEYLYRALNQPKRAIEILQAAHGRKLLAEPGRSQLAFYLEEQNRHAEAVPLLVALVAESPDNLGFRTRLMVCYSRTDKPDALRALLKATDAHFREKGKDRWNESVLAALAEATLETKLFAESVAYYEELIPMHQRAGSRRRGNALSDYYQGAARAYAGLGQTRKAVDMASGAVVSWGPNYERRKDALDVLVTVLAGAADLNAYIAELDKEPLQSAVVRKALGKAYLRKNDHARALRQFELAAELQPEDAETYELLLACCDKVGDPGLAIEQLLRAVEVTRRDPKLFAELGRRYADRKQAGASERAYTSIIDALPNESEGHAALAEVREKQGRWADAASHWERVAELRALEPTGLLRLGAAQIEAGDPKGAADTVRKLRTLSWPDRFNDVSQKTRELERKLEDRMKK